MKNSYLMFPLHVRRDLEEAEMTATAICELVDEVIDPAFGANTCKGMLDAKSKATGESEGDAALEWVTEHFDALRAASYAANVLSQRVMDILQMLPDPQEKEVE